eukprot:116333_1
MSLSASQVSPLVLRSRTIHRHATQPRNPPRLEDINPHVDRYINKIQPSVVSLNFKQQIHYWQSKITEHVHVCIDILLPDFNNFSHIVMLRWLTIGYAISQLIQIWRVNKRNITTHTRIDVWLPAIVQRNLPPNLLRVCSYGQLRKYVRMWENRELITILPKLRGEHTHRLNQMNRWIREFDKKVKLMAAQREIDIPHNIKEQVELYKVYLEHHSEPVQSDDEDDKCNALDAAVTDYLPGILQTDDDDSDSTQEDEDMSQNGSDDEGEAPRMSARELQIMKYRETIKKLKNELHQNKKALTYTRYKHCKAERERHVYRELVKHHKSEMNTLNKEIQRKNNELMRLNAQVDALKDALRKAKMYLRSTQLQFTESKKFMEKLERNCQEEERRRDNGCVSELDMDQYMTAMNRHNAGYMKVDSCYDRVVNDRDSECSNALLGEEHRYLPGIEDGDSDYDISDITGKINPNYNRKEHGNRSAYANRWNHNYH